MNPLDDLFREGLRGRAGEVPADMWARINAGKSGAVPDGEGIDQLFAGKLADRAGEVPTDMWARIAATGVTAAAGDGALDQYFAEQLKDREAEVPAGMWDRIWGRVAAPVPAFAYRRYLVASLVLLLLTLGGFVAWQLWQEAPVTTTEQETVPVVAATTRNEATTSGTGQEITAAATATTTAPEAGKTDDEAKISTTGKTEPSVVVTSRSAEPVSANDAEKKPSAVSPASGIANPQSVAEQSVATASDLEEVPVINRALSLAVAELQAEEISLLLPAVPAIEVKRQPRPQAGGSFRAAPRHRLQTELLFGIAYANQLFSVADEANRPLLSAREISEYAEVSYQVTLRTNYRLGDHLQLTGGLTYAEIRNQFEYYRVVNGVATDLRINNSIRQLEVPLLLGYRMPGRRLHVSLNAGPVINLTTSARGIFLHPDSAVPLDLATEGNYRRNTGIGFMTSLSTTYKIGNKEPFLLVVEPFFKTYPGAFSVKDAPVREKYWVAGLQLGVRKEF